MPKRKSKVSRRGKRSRSKIGREGLKKSRKIRRTQRKSRTGGTYRAKRSKRRTKRGGSSAARAKARAKAAEADLPRAIIIYAEKDERGPYTYWQVVKMLKDEAEEKKKADPESTGWGEYEGASLAQFAPGREASTDWGSSGGVSGNPSGRTKGVLFTNLVDIDAIREMDADDAADTLKQTLEEAVTAENKSLREKQDAAYNKSSNGATFFSSLFS